MNRCACHVHLPVDISEFDAIRKYLDHMQAFCKVYKKKRRYKIYKAPFRTVPFLSLFIYHTTLNQRTRERWCAIDVATSLLANRPDPHHSAVGRLLRSFSMDAVRQAQNARITMASVTGLQESI